VAQKADSMLLFILSSLVSAAVGVLLLGCIEIALCLPLGLICSKSRFLIQGFDAADVAVSALVFALHTRNIALYFEILFL
jgi:hypothetical protein